MNTRNERDGYGYAFAYDGNPLYFLNFSQIIKRIQRRIHK